MRVSSLKFPTRVLLFVLVYVLSLLLSLFVILYSPIISNLDFYLSNLEERIDDYNAGRELVPDLSGTTILLYDATGKCISNTSHGPQSININFEPIAELRLNETLSGEQKVLPILYGLPLEFDCKKLDDAHCAKGIKLLVSLPVDLESSEVKAAFLIKDYFDLASSIIGFFVVFTVLFIVIAVCLGVVQKKSRQIEKIRREYASNISHDLKTPIASVKALVETISDDLVTDENLKKQYFGIILGELTRLQHMVSEMLEMSHIQSGDQILKKSPIDPGEVFDPIIEKYSVLCDELQLVFTVSPNFSKLPMLCTDAKSISRVLENLLNNAVKFAREGDSVSVDADIGLRKVTICVKDTGIGIDKNEQDKIFMRFYKCKSSTNPSGTGLGLAIVQELLFRLGERIWVESTPGKGTAFYFTISKQAD